MHCNLSWTAGITGAGGNRKQDRRGRLGDSNHGPTTSVEAGTATLGVRT